VGRRRLVAVRPLVRIALATLLAGCIGSGAAAAPPPPVSAAAYFVRSGVDGAVLASQSASAPRPIASITKLMTVLVALEHLDLDETVVVTSAASSVGEATINLRTGERISVRELVQGALIPSANDAATALALAAADGSLPRFVEWMNEKAEALGLSDTHFVNPHGLDVRGHVSSARDVVTLLRAALANPTIRMYASTPSAVLPSHGEVETTDDLLTRYGSLVAGKTGHTNGAGWAEVAEARAGPVSVFASVLGEPTREQRNSDLEALLAWGLLQYRRVRAIDASRVYARSPAPYGRPAVALVPARSVVRLQRVGVPLVERVVYPSEVTLPVRRGVQLGEVRILERGRVVARQPLVATRSVAKPGVLGRARWYATRTLHHLGSLIS
jgi:D-alanyl-D-alanine carboxypeptidase (penicillin-binding protein 5/6)